MLRAAYKFLYHVIVLILLFMMGSQAVIAQSKTEKAKEKTDKKKEKKESDGSGIWWLELLEPILIDGSMYLFYIDKSFVPRNGPMSYSARPFSSTYGDTKGIRDWSSFKMGMLELEMDYTAPAMSSWLSQYGIEARQHMGYWAIQGSFRQWKEDVAPYGIRTWHIAGERKMLFFPNGDAGLSMGYQQTRLSNSVHAGFDIGFHAELYLFKPVSVKYEVHGINYSAFTATTSQYTLRAHWESTYFSAGYRRFNFDGAIFDGFRIGFGIMF